MNIKLILLKKVSQRNFISCKNNFKRIDEEKKVYFKNIMAVKTLFGVSFRHSIFKTGLFFSNGITITSDIAQFFFVQ